MSRLSAGAAALALGRAAASRSYRGGVVDDRSRGGVFSYQSRERPIAHRLIAASLSCRGAPGFHRRTGAALADGRCSAFLCRQECPVGRLRLSAAKTDGLIAGCALAPAAARLPCAALCRASAPELGGIGPQRFRIGVSRL